MMEIQNKLWKKGRGVQIWTCTARTSWYLYIYIERNLLLPFLFSRKLVLQLRARLFYGGRGQEEFAKKKNPGSEKCWKKYSGPKGRQFFFPDHAKVRIHCMIWKFLLALCARQFKVKKLININTNCSHSCIYQRPNTHRHKNLEKVLFKHHTICLKFANCKETSEGTVINSYSVTAGSLTYTDIHNIWQFV